MFFFVLALLFAKNLLLKSHSNATSGQLFEGKKIRTFETLTLNIDNEKLNIDVPLAIIKQFMQVNDQCKCFGVTTTIFDVSEAVQKFMLLPDSFCLIIVADRKTPTFNYSKLVSNKLFFLTCEIQEQIQNSYEFFKLLPWNNFGRKNLGYIFALTAGAEAIFDMDDDNIIISTTEFQEIFKEPAMSYYVVKNVTIINSLKFFKSKETDFLWPRGFPLEKIKSKKNEFFKVSKPQNILIWQSLADNDPDVDAIFRMTKNHTIVFEKRKVLVLDKNQFTPLNAQSCIYFKKSFFTMFLPFTVHGRVSDIWRSYIAEALLRKIDGNVVVSSPIVIQKRNPHNYLADFISEKHLYERTEVLLSVLNNFLTKNKEVTMFSIYKELYERTFFEKEDVEAVFFWENFVEKALKF